MEKGFSYWAGELWATPSQAREAWLAVRRFYGSSTSDISPWEATRLRRSQQDASSTPTKWWDTPRRRLTPWAAYRADFEEVVEGDGRWYREGHPPTAPPSLPWRRGDGESVRREKSDELRRGFSKSLDSISSVSLEKAPALGVYVESVLRFSPQRRLMQHYFEGENPAKRRKLDFDVSA